MAFVSIYHCNDNVYKVEYVEYQLETEMTSYTILTQLTESKLTYSIMYTSLIITGHK